MLKTTTLLKTTAASLGLLAAAAVTPAAVTPAAAQDAEDYLLSTASTGGTYYPVGVALATLVKVKLQPSDKIGMSAINSAGSGENVALLRDNEAQFAILQGLYGAYARNGSGPLEAEGPQENACSISMLWQNVEHFVIDAEHVDTGTVADIAALAGEAAALGSQNSGTIGSNTVLLANLGTPIDEFELVYGGYTPAAEALQNGQVEMISTPAGVPVSAITSAFANMGEGIALLGFTDEQITQANGDFGDLWTAYEIPAGTYPGQTEDVTTIAQPNFLAVRCDLPEETIYKITKTIFENLAFLQSIHPATNAMSLEAALPGLPLPLHPGAQRYFEEAGLTIPDSLVKG